MTRRRWVRGTATYATSSSTLEEARRRIERVLGRPMQSGESIHSGGRYHYLETDEYSLQVRTNIDLVENGGRSDERESAASSVLVIVSGRGIDAVEELLGKTLPNMVVIHRRVSRISD
jgi:hypothetical protein